MLKKTINSIDKYLFKLLANDGRVSFSDLAQKLSITTPTARGRVKALVKAGILRISGFIDLSTVPDLTVAIVGINIESKDNMDVTLEKLTEMEEVHWAAVVTGHYDIIAEVVVTDGMQGLYNFTCNSLPVLTPKVDSETFIIMKSKNKLLGWKEGLNSWINSTSKSTLSE